MKYLKLTLLTLLAIAALGAVATAASAESLPSMLWLTTSEVEIKGELGTHMSVVDQFNSSVGKITGTYILVELFATSGMADLGLAKILLEGSELSASKCSTEGDSLPNGTVLIDNAEWHLVLELPNNRYMFLILLPETSIKCDSGIRFKVKNSLLGLILNAELKPVASGVEAKKYYLDIECEQAGSSRSKWKPYDLHEGGPTMGNAKLEGNAGLGFEEVCEEVKGEMPLESTEAIEFMEP